MRPIAATNAIKCENRNSRGSIFADHFSEETNVNCSSRACNHQRFARVCLRQHSVQVLEIRVNNDDSDDDEDEDEDGNDAKVTDAPIPRRASSTSVPAFHGQRMSNGTFTGLPAIGEKENLPSKGSYLLYMSVFITVLLGPQLGWEISQLNSRMFHNSKDCVETLVQAGKCIVFPGHSDVEWVAAVMSWVLGASFGALFSNISADRYGRKSVVIGNAVTMIIGAALQTFAPNIFIFALGCFFSGIASSSGSTIPYLYFGEIGPPQQRVGFVVAFQCMGAFGLVAITTFHFAVTGSPTSWLWVMGLPIPFGGIQLLLAPTFLVESPKWHLHQNRDKDAASAFHTLYQSGSYRDLERVVKIEQEKNQRRDAVLAANVKASSGSSFWKDAFSSRCKRQFIIFCILCIARQFGGVSAVFYYSSGIFAGAGIADSRVGNLILGIVKHDRSGHCMVLCSIGMPFSLVYKHLALIAFTAVYVMCNSMSLSPLPFLVISEVLPEEIKTCGISIATFSNWVCNLIVSITFPLLAHYTGSYTFIPFTCLLVVFWVGVFVMLSETKDKTNKQIQQDFHNQVGSLALFKKFKKLEEEAVPEASTVDAVSHQGSHDESVSKVPRGPRRASVDFMVPMAPAMPTMSCTA